MDNTWIYDIHDAALAPAPAPSLSLSLSPPLSFSLNSLGLERLEVSTAKAVPNADFFQQT